MNASQQYLKYVMLSTVISPFFMGAYHTAYSRDILWLPGVLLLSLEIAY